METEQREVDNLTGSDKSEDTAVYGADGTRLDRSSARMKSVDRYYGVLPG
jgi:hypothetical protein